MSTTSSTVDTSRSSVSTKIFLIVAIFSLPIGVLAYLLAANYTPQIESAQTELSGNAVQKPLMTVLYGLLSSKNILEGCDSGTCGAELAKQAAVVSASLDAARTQNAQYSAELKTTDEELTKKDHKDLTFDALQAEWKGLSSATSNLATAAVRSELAGGYERMAGQVKQLVSYIGDSSNLILDPDLDSYYLVDVTLLGLPEAITHIDKTAALASKLIAGGGNAVDQFALSNESDLLQQSVDRITASNRTTFDADAANHGVSPTLQPRLGAALKQYQSSMGSYLVTLKTVAAGSSQASASTMAAQAAGAQKATLDYWNTGAAELDTLLNMRISDFQTGRIQALGYSALAVVIATIIAIALGRSITKPLQELVRNLGPGATLLGVSVERIAEASQSKTPSPEEAAIICEELNAHAENMRSAVLELARHVEGSSAASRLVGESTGPAHS